MVVDYGPNSETPVHHTDTLDLETVLRGSVDLILDDGVHHLYEGDMVRDDRRRPRLESRPRRLPHQRHPDRHPAAAVT